MMLRPSQSRRFLVLLLCLTLIDAAQNDAGARPIGEVTRFIRAEPCGQTIRYKIGAIDKRFGVDQQRVMAAAAEAADLWNAAANATALDYNSAGGVTIELIYDARQGLMQRYDDYAAALKKEEAKAEAVEEEVAGLRSQADAANASLNAEQDEYGARRDSYNAKVERMNELGGGTLAQVRALDKIKSQLEQQGSELKEKVDELSKLNARRNELVKTYNTLVDRINEMVASARKDFGGDIVAGQYIRSGNRAAIEIFAFASQSDLVAILAHEFGHALGLGHSNEPDSVMGRLHKADGILTHAPPSLAHLSQSDVAALANVCGR